MDLPSWYNDCFDEIMPLNVLFLFFRNFLWITIAITLFECFLLSFYDDAQVVLVLFWTKLASDILIGLMFAFLQPEKMYFYYNLGFSRWHLYGGALCIDLLFWVFLITSTLLSI